LGAGAGRAEGKSSRDIRRCLKRVVAWQLLKLLERYDRSTVELLGISRTDRLTDIRPRNDPGTVPVEHGSPWDVSTF
jgi:hypothetical protein